MGSDAVNSTTMCSALRRITQSEFEQYRLSTYDLLEEQRVQIVDRKRKAESAALMLEAEKVKNNKLEAFVSPGGWLGRVFGSRLHLSH